MKTKLVLAGLYGVVMGAVAGWLFFGTIAGAFGVGFAMAGCLCGALAAAASEDDTY